tara:strand:- start:103 stop:687 length:585 start_codon:yes stop_codon:yes gene_type:complete
MRTILTLSLLATALLCGCASDARDPDAPPLARDMSGPRADEGPQQGEGPAEPTPQLGENNRPWQNWKDESSGPRATLVYVTEMGVRGKRRPAALIYTSDPEIGHFRRRPSDQFTVRRLLKREMQWLLDDLSARGLEALPWSPEAQYDEPIGPERALHYYEQGKRRFVLKRELNDQDKVAFRKLEDRLIRLTISR